MLGRKAVEHEHLGARQQRGVEFEGRVLGGRADERYGAVFHHRQETVLLGAIEAMDFVDEQQRPLPGVPAALRGLENLAQFGDA